MVMVRVRGYGLGLAGWGLPLRAKFVESDGGDRPELASTNSIEPGSGSGDGWADGWDWVRGKAGVGVRVGVGVSVGLGLSDRAS